MNKKNIAFLIPSLTIGGAEKLTLSIVNELNKYKDFNIYLFLLEKDIEIDIKQKNINIIFISRISTYSKIKFLYLPIYLYKINKLIKKYNIHILYSVMERSNFINSILSYINKNYLPILSVHNAPSFSFKNRSYIRQIFIKILYKYLSYNKQIVVVSKGIKKELNEFFDINLKNIKVIYNPISIKLINKLSLESINSNIMNINKFNIVAVGRLVKQKGFDNLIKSFAKIEEEYRKDMNLIIIGDGEEKENLTSLVNNCDLNNNVKFLGYQQNPYKYMKVCDLFILSSRWEGFGIVITEAMALGLPIIAVNCKYGPEEILIKENVKFGVLIDDNEFKIENLSNAIVSLYRDKKSLNMYQNLSIQRVNDFSISIIINEYIDLFNGALNE